jgi:hypothetical protein
MSASEPKADLLDFQKSGSLHVVIERGICPDMDLALFERELLTEMMIGLA